ncbi:undecaprenyl-diphosphatase UppP [Candidatus Uhrbacteria bacterium]|jgi:undecaprenyl-diphosphatase|nr:undecaprenyl-diphosphatase UppP [Candidatus Uhrbacteria bacterium]
MNIFEAIILGVVQGITEFLPVSSSGHLILLKDWFELDTASYTFDVTVHIATLLAIIWVLRKEVWGVLSELAETPWHRTMLVKLVVATIPVGVIGVLLSDGLADALRTPWVVAVSLIVWGIALWWVDGRVKKKKTNVDLQKMSWKQTLLIGCAQALALIPGTSRSGITMIAGLSTKMSRLEAARFSFLLSIPALAGAGLFTFMDVQGSGLDIEWVPLIAGFVSAFLAGLLASSLLLKFLASNKFKPFAIYRIVLGIVILSFLF